MKVDVKKELVEKITSVEIETNGCILKLNKNSVINMKIHAVEGLVFGCRQITLGKTQYTLTHGFGEMTIDEETHNSILKMMQD